LQTLGVVTDAAIARVLRLTRTAFGKCDPVLLTAMVLGMVLRMWDFGALPPGLNQDEASTAYDAFSLIRYGVDRHGFHFPVVLVSWGSGMYALASYVEAPFIWLFGLKVWSARLPFLLAGVSAIPLFYLLLRDTADRRTARIGAVLLATSPWHVMVSRWGLDCNLFPFVFLLATLSLVRSIKHPRWLLGAAILYASALYAYGTAYVVVPIFIGLVLAHGLRHRLWPRRTILVAAAAFAVLAVPIGLYVAVNSLGWSSIETPFFSVPRLTGVPRFKTMGNLDVLSADFFRRAADNLSHAAELFRQQDDGLIWNTIPDYGIAYWFSPFLALAGLALLIGMNLRRARHSSFPVLAWCGAAVVLMAFVTVNANRANIAMLPFIYCVAIAGSLLWSYRPLRILGCFLVLLSSIGFVSTYFGPYRKAAAEPFFASFGEAIGYAAAQSKGEVCVTDTVNMPYIFVLFYTQEDPRAFARTVRYENPGAEFEGVASFGRYKFGLRTCAESASVVIAARGEAEKLDAEKFVLKEFQRYTVLSRR
jgi:MFS family permease